ncbi:holo-[acyl-carrier-protein] synthase [Candidatus Woesebacteria bacterium RBG_13_34_9]|uniref:Holo-[acyl-carrier-protein] synthase n=1 Tax=Candidatus Woesebacteria bacterium RBG_13_34_9 TaxID=1802477 RepID=A0A1F7X674_9BACT|nr:MAG: holo-[acyl-carrier-protein] synthase [Candidatus Woesebacteria bacterium RBG_13_34_9]
MQIKIGVDIVYIPKFERSIKRGGKSFLRRIFNESELKSLDIFHLAGIFAVKEAIMKTSLVPTGEWKIIEVKYKKSGKPFIALSNTLLLKIQNVDVSISHDGEYALASALVIFKNKAS